MHIPMRIRFPLGVILLLLCPISNAQQNGDFRAATGLEVLYRLPFRDGSAFSIGQTAGGFITTHTTAETQYAVDLQLPEGTPVVAAREGVVIYTQAGQSEGGPRPELLTKANEIRIRHADGTIAIYAHLAHDGVFVRPGQRVAAGDEIGLSGSTGFTGGPHLHFAVLAETHSGGGLSIVSLPFRFYVGSPPVPFSPQYGQLVRADYRPGVTLNDTTGSAALAGLAGGGQPRTMPSPAASGRPPSAGGL